jgi:DNA topoisomerase IB
MLCRLHKHIGNSNGRWSNKHHRAQKLINQWGNLQYKMFCMVDRGIRTWTDTARYALAVLVIMETGMRVGNEDSAEGYVCNQKRHKLYGKEICTYGITTLLYKHVVEQSGRFIFRFLGKKAVENELVVEGSRLVTFLAKYRLWFPTSGKLLSETPFFQIEYRQLHKFVKKYVGSHFTPKDIRTASVNWKYICNMYDLSKFPRKPTARGRASAAIKKVIKLTARSVGHSPGVCKKSYLSPHLVRYSKEELVALQNREEETKKIDIWKNYGEV